VPVAGPSHPSARPPATPRAPELLLARDRGVVFHAAKVEPLLDAPRAALAQAAGSSAGLLLVAELAAGVLLEQTIARAGGCAGGAAARRAAAVGAAGAKCGLRRLPLVENRAVERRLLILLALVLVILVADAAHLPVDVDREEELRLRLRHRRHRARRVVAPELRNV
jgi:hypothetical protein